MRWPSGGHLLGKAGGDREVEELDLAALGLNQDAFRIQILVDDLRTMELGERCREGANAARIFKIG
jgi:hypothetical protein